MKTTKTLAEMHAEHPEFVYLGKTYRCSAASGGWLYLDNRNQWRVVPKTWTHILRELPVMEDMERRAIAERTMEETKPESLATFGAREGGKSNLRVAIIGGEALAGSSLAAAVGLLKAAHMEVDHVADALAYRQQYPVRTFPQSLLAPLRWGPIPGKQPKRIGSKIEQRYARSIAKTPAPLDVAWTMNCRGDRRRNRRQANRKINKLIAVVHVKQKEFGKLFNRREYLIGKF